MCSAHLTGGEAVPGRNVSECGPVDGQLESQGDPGPRTTVPTSVCVLFVALDPCIFRDRKD